MKLLMQLIKASLTEGMHLFTLSYKKAKWTKPLVSFALCCMLMGLFAVLMYLELMVLKNTDANYVSLFLGLVSAQAITFVEAALKSQSIIINSKDNELLACMPLSSSLIMSSRLIKFLIFQCEFHFLCYAPTVICYGIYCETDLVYWLMVLIGGVILPIFPSLLGTLVGYGVNKLANLFKNRQISESVISFISCAAIVYAYARLLMTIEHLALNNSSDLEQILVLYFPAYGFVEIIRQFNPLMLLLYIAIHLLLMVLFVLTLSNNFEKEIKNLQSNANNGRRSGKVSYKAHGIDQALLLKEIKNLTDCTIYSVSTLLPPLLLMVLVIGVVFYYSALMRKFFGANLIVFAMFKPYLFFGYFLSMILTSTASQIAGCSISMEQNMLNFSKTWPVESGRILKAKINCSCLLLGIPTCLCSAIFLIRFKPELYYFVPIALISVFLPLLNSLFGIAINLLLPKFQALNDGEIVKQSASVYICSIAAFIFGLIPLGISYFTEIEFQWIMCGFAGVVLLLIVILYLLLRIWGVKRFEQINA